MDACSDIATRKQFLAGRIARASQLDFRLVSKVPFWERIAGTYCEWCVRPPSQSTHSVLTSNFLATLRKSTNTRRRRHYVVLQVLRRSLTTSSLERQRRWFGHVESNSEREQSSPQHTQTLRATPADAANAVWRGAQLKISGVGGKPLNVAWAERVTHPCYALMRLVFISLHRRSWTWVRTNARSWWVCRRTRSGRFTALEDR